MTSYLKVLTGLHRLSTSWIDAEYILDLKLPRGQKMFSESSTSSSVIYEIKCYSRRSNVGA